MSQHALKMITGATLIAPWGKPMQETALLMEGPRIHSLHESAPGSLLLSREDVELINGENCYLTPGLVELHLNGAFGTNLNHTTIAETQKMLAQLPRYGVTSALLSLVTAPLYEMMQSISTLEEVIHYRNPHHALPLGLHLEGPFLNPSHSGVHPSKAMETPTPDEVRPLLSPNVRMVTMAPELDPTGAAIQLMRERNIVVSAGHTNATLEEFDAATRQGVSSVTHLFNAMRHIHQRDPGIIAGALNNDNIFIQLIGDGVHLHPALVQTVIRAKGLEKLVLVSDCLPLAGLPEGTRQEFAGKSVTITQGMARTDEGQLAGSCLLLDECLRNVVRWGYLDFAAASQLVTHNPARLLGENRIGKLETGCYADLVLWNKQTLQVEATWVRGELAYSRNAEVKTA